MELAGMPGSPQLTVKKLIEHRPQYECIQTVSSNVYISFTQEFTSEFTDKGSWTAT